MKDMTQCGGKAACNCLSSLLVYIFSVILLLASMEIAFPGESKLSLSPSSGVRVANTVTVEKLLKSL